MKTTFKLFLVLTAGLISIQAYAQNSEMTKIQVDQYMNAYDRAFDQNRSLMQENIEAGLLRGELKLSEAQTCRSLRLKKQAQVSSLNESNNSYHQKLGALDGKWDGRLEGCQEGFHLMAQRIKSYENELKQQWLEGATLGEKIAALEMQLFSTSPLELEGKCLDARRVQGVTRLFLADEVEAKEQLSAVQLDCQSQAKLVAQRYIHHKQRLMAETQKPRLRQLERSAASLSK